MRWFLLLTLFFCTPQVAWAGSSLCADNSNGYKRSEIYYYEINSIKPHSGERLEDYLKHCFYSRIIISAHANEMDDQKSNQKLSKDRADFMLNKMIEYGYDPKRIKTHAYGDDRPFIKKNARKKEPLNRRIEIEIIW